MPKYILVYKSNEPNYMSKQSKEQVIKMMEAWGEWLGSMGSAVVDKGEAFKAGGKKLTAQGVEEADPYLNGYSIIEAKDYDEALQLVKDNPMLAAGGGSVEVYEAFGV